MMMERRHVNVVFLSIKMQEENNYTCGRVKPLLSCLVVRRDVLKRKRSIDEDAIVSREY